MNDDIGQEYAGKLQADEDAALLAEFDTPETDPQPGAAQPTSASPQATTTQAEQMQAAGGDTPANLAAHSVAANIREIPMQVLFGAASGVKQAASKVGLSDGAPVGYEPSTVTGSVARSVGQFVPGFMAASAALATLPETLPVGIAAASVRSLVAGAAAGTLDFDPKEPRISNFLQETRLANPFTEWLAADPNDSKALGTFKSAVENVGLGAAFEGIAALARLNRARIIAAEKAPKAGGKAAAKLTPEAEAAIADALDPRVDPKIAHGGNPDGPLVEVRSAGGQFDTAAQRMADAAQSAEGVGPYDVAFPVSPDPQKVYLNLARINAPDDVKAAIDSLVSRDADAINAARGGEKQTFAEIEALANEMGVNASAIIGRERGPMSGPEAVAARKLMVSSGEQLTALAKQAASAEATPADLAAFQKAAAVHYAIQTEVIAARTETARALASWRIAASGDLPLRLSDVNAALSAAGGQAEIQRIAAQLAIAAESGPQAVAATIRDGFKSDWKGVFKQMYFGNILSSPKTQVANTTDNALTALYAMPERAATAAASQTFGNGAVGFGEVPSMFWGFMRGAREGVVAAGKALRTGEGSDLFSKVESMKPSAIRAETFGADPTKALGHGINLIGRAYDVSGRLMLSADEFFKSVNMRMELHALAYRTAREEGLTGAEAAARMADIIANPPESVKQQAINFGRTQTYTAPLGPVASKIAELRNAVDNASAIGPVASFILPFVRTPANVMKWSMERTPLAPLMSGVRADIAAGGTRAAAAWGKIGLGTTVMTAVGDLVAHGQIVGGGPEEPSMRAARERMGIPQYSIKIGGEWVSFQRLGGLGTLLGLAADAAEMTGLAGWDDTEKSFAHVALVFTKSLANKSYLQGAFQTAAIAADPNSDTKAANFLQQVLTAFMPGSGLAGAVSQAYDPIARDVQEAPDTPPVNRIKGLFGVNDEAVVFAREFVNKIRARTPTLSDSLPPARDLWGRPKQYTSNLGVAYDFAIPFRVSTEKPDPVDQVIIENGIDVSMPQRSIQGVPLTGEEYSEYVRIAGEGAKSELDALVASPEFASYSDGPDGLKAMAIKQVIEGYRGAAKAQMLSDFPDLMRRVEAQALLREQILTPGLQ